MTSAHRSTDGRIFRKECRTLAEAGFEVYLVAQGESFVLDGVTVCGVPGASDRLGRMTKTAKAVYEKALSLDADIYHLHDPELIPWGVKLAKKGKKVIFDSHENYLDMIKEKTWIPSILRIPANVIFNAYFTHAMKKFVAVIIVTPYPDDRMERINKNVVMVSNYPEVTSFVQKSTLPRTLIFAGGISPQWNHETVLDALGELEEVRYILCGVVEDSYRKTLESHPMWNKVDFRGVIPFDEVQRLLHEAGIGLALLEPSANTFGQWGTMGNTKLFEEMAAGLPVICTNFELWNEIRDDFAAMKTICPHDSNELVKAINDILENQEESLAMGREGQRAVKERYSWSVEGSKLVSLYERLSCE